MFRIALAAVLALGAFAITATAQTAKPAPGCAGVQIADPAGDATSASADVTNVFFLTVGNKTTVNIQIKDLGEPGGEAVGPQTRWYASWGLGDAVKFVRAGSDGSFAYGSLDGSSYSTEGDTTGKFHSGADGIIEIVVPGGNAPKNKVLEGPAVEVKNAFAHPAGAAFVPGADPDRAPDSEGGKNYTVAPCGAGDPGTTSPGTTSPGTTSPGTTPPRSGTEEETVAKNALQVKAPSKVKAPKRKTLALKLSSPGKVTNLEGRVSKGSKVLGTGRIASLDKKGKLKIKLAKKAKKGAYTLYLVGTNPDGKRADRTLKLRLR